MMRANCCFVRVFCLLAGVLAFSSVALAAPPANDLCTGAELIPGAGPFPFVTTTSDLMEATTVGDPPAPRDCYDSDAISRSLWYQFTPTTTGLYTVSTKDNGTTVLDTLLGVYTSAAGCDGPFTLVACNDDEGINDAQVLRSALTANFDAGTTYYFVVWTTFTATNAPNPNESSVQLTITKPAVPANDLCSGAEVIPGTLPAGGHLTSVQDTYLATSTGDPASCRPDGVRSVWYKFTPAQTGAYIFSLCPNVTQTKIVDTVLAVYSASAGCGSTFTLEGCETNGICSSAASIRMALLSAGREYYILVADLEPSVSSGETDVQLQVIREAAPLVTTLPATSLSATGAVLNATANPRGLVTRGYFQYGTSTNLGSFTTTNVIGNGTADVSFSRTLGGLAAGTTYYYRGAAFNSLGTRFGEILSFTTPGTRFEITSVAMQSGGLRLEFVGTQGAVHTVQGSDDLNSWSDLGTATPLGGNRFEYLDAGALQRPFRFYQVKR